jgi:quercetin 2,3-dioxygenase
MKTVLHKASGRGQADHGWLKAHYSFSFAGYYNPERMHFGTIRVLNDDLIAPGGGFGLHPHDNMEIITIPLLGELEHTDSMGNTGTIRHGEIQVMSAGTGILHSECNRSPDQELSLLQIWIFPHSRNLKPRYDQRTFPAEDRIDHLQLVISPDDHPDTLSIQQHAWFSLGNFESGTGINYQIRRPGNGVYLFVIEGPVSVEDQALKKRDAIGIWEAESVSINAEPGSSILVMDVPMN